MPLLALRVVVYSVHSYYSSWSSIYCRPNTSSSMTLTQHSYANRL